MKQQRKLKILDKREKREDRSVVNLNKRIHTGDVHHVLASQKSKTFGCTLPEIVNRQLMTQQTGKTRRACSGKVAPTHFPPLPVKAVVQQQIKKSSKRSSASSLGLDSQHLQQDRHYFEEQKLPMIPAVVKQSSGNKHGSQLKRDRPMPVRLPPIEYTIQSSSGSAWSAGHKPDMLGLGRTAELNSICKLPDIKNAPVKCSRPKSGNLPRLLSVLPPISGRTEELDKNRKLPPRANMQRAESPTTDKTKKKRKMKLTFK